MTDFVGAGFLCHHLGYRLSCYLCFGSVSAAVFAVAFDSASILSAFELLTLLILPRFSRLLSC